MGTHTSDGRFHLIVSFRYGESDAVSQSEGWENEKDYWKRALDDASSLLYGATDGQHWIDKVYYCLNSTGTGIADAFLEPDGTLSSANGRIWLPGTHIQFTNKAKGQPFLVLHELAHYVYGVADEYEDPIGADIQSICLGRDTSGDLPGACIMEAMAEDGDQYLSAGLVYFHAGNVLDFCVKCNHDKGSGGTVCNDGNDTAYVTGDAGQNKQTARHGESCWETITDRYATAEEPGTSPDPTRLDAPEHIQWIELVEEPRFGLTIEHSKRMESTGDWPLSEVKAAAMDWLDFAPNGESIAGVKFNDFVVTGGPVDLNPSVRNSGKVYIENIVAEGGTALGHAVYSSGQLIRGGGPVSSTQAMVLFSGSANNTGPSPFQALTFLRKNQVRVYAIAAGPHADLFTLGYLAWATGGRLFYAPYPWLATPGWSTIRGATAIIFALTHYGAGTVTVDAGQTPDVPDDYVPPDDGFDDNQYTAWIEEGSEAAIFSVRWEGDAELDLEVTDPDGKPVQGQGVRTAGEDRGFRLVEVPDPKPGRWGFAARTPPEVARREEDPVPIQHTVISRNRRVDFALSTGQPVYALGDRVRVIGQITYDRVITGLRVEGRVRLPDGSAKEFALHDDGNPKHGSECSGCGIYTNYFRPEEEGVYEFTIVADATEERLVSVAEGGDTSGPQKIAEEPIRIPSFVRKWSCTVLVGPPRRGRPSTKPNLLNQGYRGPLEVSMAGVPWVPGVSTLSLGPGIRAIETGEGADGPRFDVEVSVRALPGARRGTVVTGEGLYRLEDLVRVEGDIPPPLKASPKRRTRPGAWFRERRKRDGDPR